MSQQPAPAPPPTAVVGSTGFVGAAVAAELHAGETKVVAVHAPRLRVAPSADPVVAAHAWIRAEGAAFDAIVQQFRGCAVVVNAAGVAAPTSPESAELWGGNAVLPAVLVAAAGRAGVQRFVHVSSAAVQGAAEVLDERPFDRGHSPYAQAKGAGELAVSALAAEHPGTSCVIYRPTSVLAAERAVAVRLAQVLRSRWVPLLGGDVPLPVTTVAHVARAIVFLATCADSPSIVVHPWEGMTVSSLASALGRSRPFLTLPRPLAGIARAAVSVLARGGPVAGQVRRLQLLWDGQQQRSSLPELGFDLGDPAAAFDRLGRELLLHSP